MGKHGPGTRGTRPEGPFEPPTPLVSHMPASELADQGEFGSSKRGIHESDFSGNATAKPKELRGGISNSGDQAFEGNAEVTGFEANKSDPRRSHS